MNVELVNKLNLVSYLTREFSLKATCQHGFLVDLYGSLICMNFSMDMNSSLVLLKLDVKLNLLSHISQWNFVCNFIQSCLPLKSCHFKSRCPIEAFVAYLKMKSCLLFHLKLWIFEKRFQVLFSNLDVKLDLLSKISQWNFVFSSL